MKLAILVALFLGHMWVCHTHRKSEHDLLEQDHFEFSSLVITLGLMITTIVVL